MKYQYVQDFKNLKFGMFVHFGLYSVLGKGEWAIELLKIPYSKYDKLIDKFNPSKTWAKELVKIAKDAGCKYITLTTRHHDGFSLYDTKGLSNYDINLIKSKRDLVREFVDECNAQGIVPFFYHTLLDFHHPDYRNNFNEYLVYLRKSIEILCTNYGKIGGLWFDGMWDKWDSDWQEDLLYGTIRKYQPDAMIINNTGLSFGGRIGHPELDSVTFERGNNVKQIEAQGRPVAMEMCDSLTEHWGYAAYDIKYKPIKTVLENMITASSCGANTLLNVGPMGNGKLSDMDKGYFSCIGKFNKMTKNVIFKFQKTDITAEIFSQDEGGNRVAAGVTEVYKDNEDNYYVVIDDVPTGGTNDVMQNATVFDVKINADVKNVKYVDTGKAIKVKNNTFTVEPYTYGVNLCYRIIKFNLK